MNLAAMLAKRAADGRPVRVGVIGAGKFGSMYLSQARRTPGTHLVGVAELSVARGRAALDRVGWPAAQYASASIEAALADGTTCVTEDVSALIEAVDVVVEATGVPALGIRHARHAFAHGTHVVMVNVEADVLAGPQLAREAARAGVVYSLAYGDQPALVCEMVDWAQTAGFEVVCAGKGTKYLPRYHRLTPEDVWNEYGLTAEQAAEGGMNPQMFCSFMDGTKSAIEMAAIANATGLSAPVDGLEFPPVGTDDLPYVLRPRPAGGQLARAGTVEVVSSLERDGRPVHRDLRWGVYVVFEAPSDYVARCFQEYGLVTDPSGRYAAMYKPFHLIGLEVGVSVASVALRGEATGAAVGWRGDAVAVAKKDLRQGDMLDGEGGHAVWGRLTTAAASLDGGLLPIGLAHGLTLKTSVKEGAPVRWCDVAFDAADPTIAYRREMERAFAPGLRA